MDDSNEAGGWWIRLTVADHVRNRFIDSGLGREFASEADAREAMAELKRIEPPKNDAEDVTYIFDLMSDRGIEDDAYCSVETFERLFGASPESPDHYWSLPHNAGVREAVKRWRELCAARPAEVTP